MKRACETFRRGYPAALLLIAFVAGCASVPQASREHDAEAKQFVTHPATGALYVYRSQLDDPDTESVLYLDHRLIGATLPGGYFRIDAQPGKRVLHGTGRDQGHLTIDVRPGSISFVSLRVVADNSYFQLRPGEAGRADLLACCVLLENWSPGQRPLLR